MTIETKTTVQLSDIRTVEFECKKCHSISSWPLEIAREVPVKCHCDSEQWMAYGGDQYAAMARLLMLMQRFSTANNEPFVMRFGLAASVHASDDKD